MQILYPIIIKENFDFLLIPKVMCFVQVTLDFLLVIMLSRRSILDISDGDSLNEKFFIKVLIPLI